jgi:sialate O-acetylesterase
MLRFAVRGLEGWVFALTRTGGFAAIRPMISRLRCLTILLMLCGGSWTLPALRADVRLPALFTDHMVLQQMMPVRVWGWADEGETVVVQFRQARVSTIARKGRWQVRLPRQLAGGPDSLIVTGRNRIEVADVMVGEVWVCSGQSNMEWPMSRSEDPAQAIAESENPMIRLFTVPKLKAQLPVHDVKASWQLCGPKTVENFSAVAYYFGRELQQARRVPVGLIHTSWGGSPAEVWMSEPVLSANPEYQRDILDTYPAAWRSYQKALASFDQEAAEAKQAGREFNRGRPWQPWRPTELYNGMIHPLLGYAIRGAIWYQGESNAGRAYQYRSLFPDMIRNWRRDWGQGDFTFLAVQLAPWDMNRKRSIAEITATPGESAWAELREAQVYATKVLPKVGVAIITDVGDKDDIHPQQKRIVGERLARLARSIAHRESLVPNGPHYRSHQVNRDKIVVSFEHVGGGLLARGERLEGFAICGEDRKWHWGDATILQGRRVVVSSPSAPEPIAVRYGWADYPVVNLYNQEGLPASPFRTDQFPLTTAPKASQK